MTELYVKRLALLMGYDYWTKHSLKFPNTIDGKNYGEFFCCLLILCMISCYFVLFSDYFLFEDKGSILNRLVAFAPYLIFFYVINFLDTGFEFFLNDVSPFSRAAVSWLLANIPQMER